MTNTDEYRAEAETIVIRLPEATSQNDVQRIVHEEFVRWFDQSLAGPVERYLAISEGNLGTVDWRSERWRVFPGVRSGRRAQAQVSG